ncbi:MAG: hypothetical protein JRD89_00885 [Deltaproteobacteria bacterium]|nr:hypothetical protein [Deltaproteobacteria bacterium]
MPTPCELCGRPSTRYSWVPKYEKRLSLCEPHYALLKSRELANVTGITCENCGLPDAKIKHHTSYFPEKTVIVCDHCHKEIHKDPTHPLYPRDLPRCPACGRILERRKKGWVCKNHLCINYWKLGRGPIIIQDNQVD